MADENETVEVETTPSTNEETNTVDTTEMSEAGTLDQPDVEAKPSRAQERIESLSRAKKEAEARAEYWENLKAPEPTAPPEAENEYLTADQIADVTMQKLEMKESAKRMAVAQQEIASDAAQTLVKYPDLESDDDLAQAVFGLAQSRGIKMEAAADIVMGKLEKAREKATNQKLAEEKTRTGVTAPQGSPVSDGTPPKIDINNMSPAEKAANWEKIIANYQ